jgi:parallel beta-helix repeat protein
MKKKVAAFWLSLVMMLGVIVIVIEICEPVSGNVLYVGGTEPGNFSKIQDAINASQDGDTVFVYSGTYYENIVVNKSINLTGENKQNTFINGGDKGDTINVSANWVNITGFNITNNFTLNYWNGLFVYFSSNCSIADNIIFTNDLWYGIFLLSSSNNEIINNNISDNFYGMLLRRSSNNNITNNNFSSNYMCGIAIEENSNENKIVNNRINSTYWDGIHIWSSLNNNIISNNISWIGYDGIDLSTSSNTTIVGNNISNCWHCIWISNSSALKIKGNNLSSGVGIGMHISGSRNINVSANNLTNDGIFLGGTKLQHFNSHAIYDNKVNNKSLYYYKNCSDIIIDGVSVGQLILANCSNMQLRNLEINNTDNGIEIAFSSNISMKNSNISSNDRSGIYSYGSSNNTLLGNNITLNYYGIKTRLLLFTQISGNNLIDNDFGMWINSSSNNNITSNILLNNLRGLKIEDSYDNYIYHNNFVDNTIPAYDDTDMGNQWDNGYPSGGNFWSDYSGLDEFSGPNQDEPGNDGIGDTNYSINIISVDNYPLMYPIGNRTYLYEGWNLVSIPFIQPDTDLGSVLSTINGLWDTIEWYNVSDNLDNWKVNNTSKSSYLNDINMINHSIGFWIHITEPGGILFEYPGIQPTQNQNITLHPGWNMVGYPSKTSYNRTLALNNVDFGDQVDAVWTYNAAAQRWGEIGEFDHFFMGKGYWIHSNVKIAWEVPL